jgi:hypothetical protein
MRDAAGMAQTRMFAVTTGHTMTTELWRFHADTNEAEFPACGAAAGIVTRELSFATAHRLSELMQAWYKAGFEAGLAEAVRRVKGGSLFP